MEMVKLTVFALYVLLKYVSCTEDTILDVTERSLLKELPSHLEECGNSSSPRAEDSICFCVSPNIENQIVVVNDKGDTYLVINTDLQKYGAFDKNGQIVIFDEDTGNAYTITDGYDWDGDYNSILSLNLSTLINGTVPKQIKTITEGTFEMEVLVRVFGGFGYNTSNIIDLPEKTESKKIKDFVANITENLFDETRYLTDIVTLASIIYIPDKIFQYTFILILGGLVIYFRNIIQLFIVTVKELLGTFITCTLGLWTHVEHGILRLFKVVTYIREFIGTITGGVAVLIAKGISVSIDAIMTAENGVEAFLILFKPMCKLFDLTVIWKAVLSVPSTIFNIFAGFGGMILWGVSGIFTVICEIVRLIKVVVTRTVDTGIKSITYYIEYLMELLIMFFQYIKTIPENFHEIMKSVIAVIEIQIEEFGNALGLQAIIDIIKGTFSELPILIWGVDIAPCFEALTKSGISMSLYELVTAIFNTLKSVLSLSSAVPKLVYCLIMKLFSPFGVRALKPVLPDLQLEGQEGQMRALPYNQLGEMTTQDLIEQYPAAGQIIKEFKKAAEAVGGPQVKSELDAKITPNIKFLELAQ